MTHLNIRLVRGPEADLLVADDAFATRWSELASECPWGTGFQTPGYVRTWYSTYRERFEPLLLLARRADGTLDGLLTLAVSRRGGRVVVAGDVQAEYQVWIARPEFGDAFALVAWRKLRDAFPSAALRFNYLPPTTPKAWLNDAEVKPVFLMRAHSRPVLRFEDGQQVAASLAKKSNKNRLRQLEKLGPVTFERVTDPADRHRLFEELIPYHDARHAAMRGSSPFTNDALMRRFGTALLSVPDLLHVTVLRCGGRFASAHIGVRGGREVEFGLIAHNPWLAKYSPGKFHVLFLARMLREEGFEQLDLTAGGDAYKDRFASGCDEVHTLTLLPGTAARAAGLVRESVKGAARRILAAARVSPNQARARAARLRNFRPAAIAAALRRAATVRIRAREGKAVYTTELDAPPPIQDVSPIRVDSLADLLCYQGPPGAPTRQDFLSAALRRIEEGQHVYSHVVDGRLIHVGWRIDHPSDSDARRILGNHGADLETASVAELSPCGDAPDASVFERFLRRVLHDAAAAPGVKRLVVAVRSGDVALRRTLERLGFSCPRPSNPEPSDAPPIPADGRVCLTASAE